MANKLAILFICYIAVCLSASRVLAEEHLSESSGYISLSEEQLFKQYPEFEKAEQELTKVVEDWKTTIDSFSEQIELLQLDNSVDNSELINTLTIQKFSFTDSIFKPQGEYDEAVERILRPIITKIEKDSMKNLKLNNEHPVYRKED